MYAKQKGFPYWPAKVVGSQENTEGQIEVRFFGGFHQRALVEKHHIKPITTNIHTLQVGIEYCQNPNTTSIDLHLTITTTNRPLDLDTTQINIVNAFLAGKKGLCDKQFFQKSKKYELAMFSLTVNMT